MKTNLILLIAFVALCLSTQNAFAQSSIGIRGGTAIFTVKNYPFEQEGIKLNEEVFFGNYNAVSFEIGLSEKFALQPEVNYIQKGGRLDSTKDDELEFKVEMNYLETPLLAKFRFGTSALKGYVIVGPSVGYAIGGQTQIETGDDENEIEIEEDITFDDEYGIDGRKDNRFDFSAVAGGGVQYRLGPGSIVLDARVHYDFNDFNKFESTEADWSDKVRWEGVSVSLGYQFEF